MTMNYQKITVPLFRERLKLNMYETITAARRAIGKAEWSDDERQHAHAFANKHFNAPKAVTRAPSPAAVKASADKALLKAAQKPAPKAVQKPAAAKPATQKPAVAKPAPQKPVQQQKVKPKAASKSSSATSRKLSTGLSATSTNAEIIEICGASNQIVEIIRKCAEVSDATKPTLNEATGLLLDCLKVLHAALKKAGPEIVAERADRQPKFGTPVTPKTHIVRPAVLDGEAARTAASG